MEDTLWRWKVYSWWGWPVPRVVKSPTSRQLRDLIDTAADSGFSRKARGLEVKDGGTYYLVPYLFESTPANCWICIVVAIESRSSPEGGGRPSISYARLDVSIDRYRRLPRASRRQRDQLLHFMAWEAAKGRMSDGSS